MNDVLFIVPPFYPGVHPNLSVSILKSMLIKKQIDSKILYSNLYFKQMVNQNFYEELSVMLHLDNFAEYIFSQAAFPEIANRHNEFLEKIKQDSYETFTNINNIMKKTNKFLDKILSIIVNELPKIIYFNIFMKQLTSSIALINKIKEKIPFTIITAGGFSCNFPVGNELLNACKNIDYIFQGEIEDKFIDFCINILKKKQKKTFRRIIICQPVKNLNKLPIPDFKDFFSQSIKLWNIQNNIIFESSRGCWWAEKSNCIFCSGYHNNLKYRIKKPGRIKRELKFFIKKHKPSYIVANDAIMPLNFIDKVIKPLNKRGIKTNLIYEIKPYVSYENLKILKQSNLKYCQPGIESFSNEILKILKKGTTVLTNICFLRNCKTLNIIAKWNFLYNIPGEKEDNYINILKFLKDLRHLNPPKDIRKILIPRGSPIFKNAELFNIKLKPLTSYYYIFPEYINLKNISILFNGECKSALDNKKLKDKFFSEMNLWINSWKNDVHPELILIEGKNKLYIKDTRQVENKMFIINNKHLFLLKNFESPCHINQQNLSDYKKQLSELFKWKCLLKINHKVLSLVTNTNELQYKDLK